MKKKAAAIGLVWVLAAAGVGTAGAAGPTAATAGEEAGFFLHNGDHVVFFGDSITDGQWYPTIVQTFVLTRYPQWRNQFVNRGVSGEASGVIKRFARDAADRQPQAILYNMGYNDTGYDPLKSDRLQKYLDNIATSVAMAREKNPQVRILLASAVPNEADQYHEDRWHASARAQAYTLLCYAQEEEKLATRLGLPFVNLTTLYGQTMGLGHVVGGSTLLLSRDGVHPETVGQTFIAYHLLRGMGGEAELADVEIDAAAGKVTAARRCRVSDLAVKDGVVSFSRVCDSLPMPIPVPARPVAFLVRFDDTLNNDRLAVSGLTAPSYAVSVDGQRVGQVPSASLAEGINLSLFRDTPMYKQAMAVMDAVRAKDLVDYAVFTAYIKPGKVDGAAQPILSADPNIATDPNVAAALAGKLAELQKATAACYELNAPRPHAIRLEPLEANLPRFGSFVEQPANQAYILPSLSPLAVNWNTMAVTGEQTTLTIKNPNSTAKSGTVHWTLRDGWTISPQDANFTAEAGKSVKVPFTITAPQGALANFSLPVATVRSSFASEWPYPVIEQVTLPLAPTLTIPRSKKPVVMDGKPIDWDDAVSFPMNHPYFVMPQATGRGPLWSGPDDLSAKIYMKWDDKAFYFAADVVDNEHLQNATEGMMWSQDSIYFGALMREGKVDARYEMGFGIYGDGDRVSRRLDMYPKPPKPPASPAIEFVSGSDPATHHYRYKIAVPWEQLPPIVPAVNKSFRFTFVLNDADSVPERGLVYMEWTPGIHFGKNAEDFGTITLGP